MNSISLLRACFESYNSVSKLYPSGNYKAAYRVVGAAGHADLAREGTDGEEVAVRLAQVLSSGADGVVDTKDVDLEGVPPDVGGLLIQSCRTRSAAFLRQKKNKLTVGEARDGTRVGDDNVEPAERPDGAVDGGLDLGGVLDVYDVLLDLGVRDRCEDGRLRLVELAARARGDGDVRAGLGKDDRGGAPDAAAGTSDEDGLALEGLRGEGGGGVDGGVNAVATRLAAVLQFRNRSKRTRGAPRRGDPQ